MRTHRVGAVLLLFAVVSIFGAMFLATIGIDALQGNNSFQFYADSQTYHEVARGDLERIEGWFDTVGFAGNFLGPLVILRLTGENYYFVMLFDVAVLAGSIILLARTLRLDPLRYSLVLLANPVVVSSILSVNKEVLGIATLACMLNAFKTRSLAMSLAAAVLSFLMRWQMTVFVLVLVAAVGGLNPIRSRRGATLGVLLLALSMLYLALASAFETIRFNFELGVQDYEGSGLYEWLVHMQDAGYYWLVFPVKAAHLLFGLGLRLDRLLAPVDIYNDCIQLLHSTALLVLFVLLLRQRRFRLENDLIYASAIYLAIFAISPIYAPRYLLPVYVMWAAAAVGSAKPVRLFVSPHVRYRRRRMTVRDAGSSTAHFRS